MIQILCSIMATWCPVHSIPFPLIVHGLTLSSFDQVGGIRDEEVRMSGPATSCPNSPFCFGPLLEALAFCFFSWVFVRSLWVFTFSLSFTVHFARVVVRSPPPCQHSKFHLCHNIQRHRPHVCGCFSILFSTYASISRPPARNSHISKPDRGKGKAYLCSDHQLTP